MSRQLTHTETEELFQICRNYGVYHYDVQIEFVDHLASSIEEIWESQPAMDFATARKQVVQQFGVRNFTKIYAEKEKALIKRYNRLLWNYILEFYKLPKVIMTFVFTIGLFLVFQVVEQTVWILLSYAVLLIAASVVYFFIVYPKFKVKTDSWKSFLLLDYMRQIRNTFLLVFQLPGICMNSFKWAGVDSIDNNWILFGMSFLMVFLNVILYAHFFYIPQRIREHFIETYPEFVIQ